jgi:hypothetical protein
MSSFKNGELVLVSNGNGGFQVAKTIRNMFYSQTERGYCWYISFGNYATPYKEEHIHKCPSSIKKLVEEKQ